MPIRYMKAAPTTYVIQFQDGKVKREGPGLSFLYWAPTTTLVAVPLASADVPFVFNEVTQDFQAVTLQGQLTYRVADPKRLASLLDYSITPSGRVPLRRSGEAGGAAGAGGAGAGAHGGAGHGPARGAGRSEVVEAQVLAALGARRPSACWAWR